MTARRLFVAVLIACCPFVLHLQAQRAAPAQAPVIVASKPFGESYVLAEMFAQLLESHGIPVERKPGLGSTDILIKALQSGAIDVYPEYTGTGLIAVLHDTLPATEMANAQHVFAHVSTQFQARYGARWLPPLGFQNTYAIAVRRETATRYKLRTLSDLARESSHLTAGFTADFIGRPDGLAGLTQAYGASMRPGEIKPLMPALKYGALASGAVDVIDGYSTDGLIERYGLVVLEDDKNFFPPYEAATLVGAKAAARPDVIAVLTLLSGRIDVDRMRKLNRRIEVDGVDVRLVAASALRELALDQSGSSDASAAPQGASRSFLPYLWSERTTIARLTLRHLWLVALGMLAAALVAIPLGLALERARRAEGPTFALLGILQTIPSIALLAFLVPLVGVGVVPALIALWLYALYPIARGTYTGVRDADPAAVEAAEALGMTPMQRLLRVRLPLAAPVIMAGVRTAAVITVGAATLAAFIGAGGLGEPIVTGLALANSQMILSGALPAALLALAVDGVLLLIERRVMPAHLRSARRRHRAS
jgi:osmoprotectant transport system permease protein